jgi:hypothetical protein
LPWQQVRRFAVALLWLLAALPLLPLGVMLYASAWLLEALGDRRATRQTHGLFLTNELPRQQLPRHHLHEPAAARNASPSMEHNHHA